MVAGLVEAVPVSVYRSFSFTKLAAQAAGGLVRVNVTPSQATVIIPAGAILSQPTSSVQYRAVVDSVVQPSSSFADVPVVGLSPGLASNLPVNTAFEFDQPPAGFVSASNLVAFVSGSDDETDAELLLRFNGYIKTLARGTPDALRFGAKEAAFVTDVNGNLVERVAFVSIEEPYLENPLNPVGLVKVYVHNGVGGTSPALIARVATVLHGYRNPDGSRVPGYKAAGVQVLVYAATETPVPVSAVLTVGPNVLHSDAALTVSNLVAGYIAGLDIATTCIMAEIVSLAMAVPGVVNFQIASDVDVPAVISEKLVPGAIVLT